MDKLMLVAQATVQTLHDAQQPDPKHIPPPHQNGRKKFSDNSILTRHVMPCMLYMDH